MTVTLNARTLKWIEYVKGRSDRQRAKDVAWKIRRQIDMWEKIRTVTEWTSITGMVRDGEDLRYVRRFVMALEEAGLLETRKGPQYPFATQFRVNSHGDWKQKRRTLRPAGQRKKRSLIKP